MKTCYLAKGILDPAQELHIYQADSTLIKGAANNQFLVRFDRVPVVSSFFTPTLGSRCRFLVSVLVPLALALALVLLLSALTPLLVTLLLLLAA